MGWDQCGAFVRPFDDMFDWLSGSQRNSCRSPVILTADAFSAGGGFCRIMGSSLLYRPLPTADVFDGHVVCSTVTWQPKRLTDAQRVQEHSCAALMPRWQATVRLHCSWSEKRAGSGVLHYRDGFRLGTDAACPGKNKQRASRKACQGACLSVG